jgi:hypothetical protein
LIILATTEAAAVIEPVSGRCRDRIRLRHRFGGRPWWRCIPYRGVLAESARPQFEVATSPGRYGGVLLPHLNPIRELEKRGKMGSFISRSQELTARSHFISNHDS